MRWTATNEFDRSIGIEPLKYKVNIWRRKSVLGDVECSFKRPVALADPFGARSLLEW